VQLISDGGHVADELIGSLSWRRRTVLSCSDATSLSGGGESGRNARRRAHHLVQGVARRADGTIAGGASTLLEAVQRLASLSLGMATALAAVTELPPASSAAKTLAICARGSSQPRGPGRQPHSAQVVINGVPAGGR